MIPAASVTVVAIFTAIPALIRESLIGMHRSPNDDEDDDDQGYSVLVRMIADRAHSTSAAAVKSLIFLSPLCTLHNLHLTLHIMYLMYIAHCTLHNI